METRYSLKLEHVTSLTASVIALSFLSSLSYEWGLVNGFGTSLRQLPISLIDITGAVVKYPLYMLAILLTLIFSRSFSKSKISHVITDNLKGKNKVLRITLLFIPLILIPIITILFNVSLGLIMLSFAVFVVLFSIYIDLIFGAIMSFGIDNNTTKIILISFGLLFSIYYMGYAKSIQIASNESKPNIALLTDDGWIKGKIIQQNSFGYMIYNSKIIIIPNEKIKEVNMIDIKSISTDGLICKVKNPVCSLYMKYSNF